MNNLDGEVDTYTDILIHQYYSMPQNSKRGKNMNAWHCLSFKFETTAITAKGIFSFLGGVCLGLYNPTNFELSSSKFVGLYNLSRL
jgi:hypothetical protein